MANFLFSKVEKSKKVGGINSRSHLLSGNSDKSLNNSAKKHPSKAPHVFYLFSGGNEEKA